jgi:predicted unusual protein kinase regulating ubiquinone biosynthesis (AarF/ABC1/UbiB family)
MRFRLRIAEVVAQQQNSTVGKMQVGRVVMEVKQIAGNCGIRVPAEMTMLGKTLLNLDLVGRTLAPDFDPNQSIRRNAAELLHQRTMKGLSAGNIFTALLETKELIEKLPSRVNQFLDLVATNKLRVKVDAIDENLLMAGMQKVANRITLGLILAALIIGAAMLMRVETTFRIFGYPGLAIVCFLLASAGGVALVIEILRTDRPAK